MSVSIDEALSDPGLLGAALGDLSTWGPWRVILKAAFALPLSRSERRVFAALAGGRKPPAKPVSELWVAAGRRSGKSRMAALIASYIASFVDHSQALSRGERGYVLALSPSRAQARLIRDYVEGFYGASPVLQGLIESTTADEIRLADGVSIATHPNSFRTVRGRSLLASIFDECAFWRDENSASPDIEVARAVLPALATTGGMLIGISSPYRRVGLLHQRYRDHYGQDGDILVVQAPSLALNPTLRKGVIDRAMRDDAEAARSEWLAEFRSDLSSLLDDAIIDAAIDYDRPLELPPRTAHRYSAFVDASGGRHDAFTLGIGHLEGERFVLDALRGRKPPFHPGDVVMEYAALAADYGCSDVMGDQYAGEWVAQAFEAHGATYVTSPMPKSGLYLEAVPAFMRGAVSIPNDPQLIRELRLLERRVAPSGRDRVDHPQGGTDDFANALAGCMTAVRHPGDETVVLSFAQMVGRR